MEYKMHFFISNDILVNGNKQDDGVTQTLDQHQYPIAYILNIYIFP